jgi:signal transduction histidine kinase
MTRVSTIFRSPGQRLRLRRPETVRLERMIRDNFWQDLVVQAVLVGVGVLWFSNRWIWALWGIRWFVLLAIGGAWRSIRNGRLTRALLLLAGGHVLGVIGLVAIVPVLTPLGMLILVGDLFLGSYLHDPARKRYFIAMVPIISGVVALSFQSWTDLADRTPRGVAIPLIIAHTLGSGFFIPKSHRQHYVQLRLARERLAASEQRLSSAVLSERARIAHELQEEPVAGIGLLLGDLRRIRENLDPQPEVAAGIADAATVKTQDALRSLRRISHGVYPELLQSGLHESLRQLLGSVGELEQFEVPKTRLPVDVEAAIYMAVRELVREPLVVNRSSDTSQLLRIEIEAEEVHLFLRFNGLAQYNDAALSPMPTDRIVAIGGESSVTVRGHGLEFLARVPLRATQPEPRLSDSVRVDASLSILSVFTTWGLRGAILALTVSGLVLLISQELSGALVVGAFAWLAAGAAIGRWLVKRNRYGPSIAALCVASLTSAVFITAVVTELAPLMALVISLPTTFALPFLNERRLDLIAFFQGVSLAALTVIFYLDSPLIERVVAPIVPALVVPFGAGAAAALIGVTLVATVRTVTDASAHGIAELGRIVQAADSKRQSIERDLHDGAQQLFVAISLQFRSLTKLVRSDPARALRVIDTTESLLNQARVGLINVARGTLVPELDEGRLAEAMHRGIGALSTSDHTVTLRVRGVDAVAPELATAVYFCCHEALQNAMKHGGRPLVVTVTVAPDGDRVRFEVRDNGVGFEIGAVGTGSGLPSMTARIDELQGELSFRSQIGSGTVVAGSLPNI